MLNVYKTIAVTSGNYNAKALLKYKPDYLVDDLKDVEKVLLYFLFKTSHYNSL